jgi:hypothetical protein
VDTSKEPLPLLAEYLASVAALPESQRTAMIWEDQQRRQQRGALPAVESYLQALPVPVNDSLLLDLIYGEFMARREGGERPTADEYVRRFPALAEPIRRQLALHEGLSQVGSPLAVPAQTSEQASSSPTIPVSTAWPTAEPTSQPALPVMILSYLVVAPLDRGGQGSVFRGIHPTLGRDVVIKLGHALAEPDQASDLLLQEGRILAELDHPGLARVYDLQLYNGRPCLVMEFIRGLNLEQHARQHALTPREAAGLVAHLARAVAAAHHRGVIHRDIKPRNVLIDDAGHLRLIDFGLARVETPWQEAPEEHGLAGTVCYMAPEQARGEPVSPRSDVFGLGGVLYFLLTGRAPFTGRTFDEVYDRANRNDWDRAALADSRIPAGLRRLVEKAMAAKPEDRPETAEELAVELEDMARPRRWWAWLAGAAVTCALIALLIGFWPDRSGSHTPDNPGVPPKAFEPRPFSLTVRVWGGQRYAELIDSVPLSGEREVRVEAGVPSGMHAALFAFSGMGKPALLVAIAPADAEQVLSYPGAVHQAAPLRGSGNELVLLLARRSGRLELDEVRPLLDIDGWPKLPGESVLRLAPNEVKIIQRSREFGGPRDRLDAEGEVRQRLDQLRAQLRERFDHFEGLAFAHGE